MCHMCYRAWYAGTYLAGVSLSGDATFRVTKKATVVNAKKQRIEVLVGGCFTVLNEDTKIIKWVRDFVTCDKRK